MSKSLKFLCSLFLLFIFSIGILNLFKEDQYFSEIENRVLTQRPEFTLKTLFSGEYMKQAEAYLSDQFVGKIGWISLRARAEQLLQKQDSNGIYFAKDGYLLERFQEPNEVLERNIAIIENFAKRYPTRNISLLLVPTSIEIYKDKLPPFAPTYSQEKIIEEVQNELSGSLQVGSPLEKLQQHKDEGIYFKSDHHWTMKGAYYGYVEAAKLLGLEPYSLTDFREERVSSNFFGTYASKAIGFNVEGDSIHAFTPKFPTEYNIKYVDEGRTSTSLFQWDALQKRDQYTFFLNGNHSYVKITSHVKNGKTLAVVKDSYAHAMLPFLANHYENIHIIDLRYFHRSMEQFLTEHEIEDILLLYNIPNFTSEPNLIWLKS